MERVSTAWLDASPDDRPVAHVTLCGMGSNVPNARFGGERDVVGWRSDPDLFWSPDDRYARQLAGCEVLYFPFANVRPLVEGRYNILVIVESRGQVLGQLRNPYISRAANVSAPTRLKWMGYPSRCLSKKASSP